GLPPPLLLTRVTDARFQRTAVSTSAMWYQKPASPVNTTTGRSGHAALAPMPAGKAQPRWPALRRELCAGVRRSYMPPIHMPAWPVSTTTIASSGTCRLNSLQMRAGWIGTASDSSIGLYLAYQSVRSAVISLIQGARLTALDLSI